MPGIPLRRTGTFSELTYHTGGRGSFRVLSSGPTAGIHPSIGSLVGGGGYAGWLSAADATVSLCDHGNYSLASTYRGFTLDYRENSGFFGGYSSERFQAAGGPEAFVAGISPAIGEGFSLGPAWCEGPPWGLCLAPGILFPGRASGGDRRGGGGGQSTAQGTGHAGLRWSDGIRRV